MNVFISYSINDNDQYILTLLSAKLREKNFVVKTSQNFYGQYLDYGTQNDIHFSNLFVGLLTGSGIELNRVLEEWRYAQSKNIPTLLLIEDTVNINRTFRGNYILFNRFRPQSAINEINNRMSPPPARRVATQSKKSDDIIPWLLGGAALVAILSVLSNDKK